MPAALSTGPASPRRRLPELSMRSVDPDEAREVGTRVYHSHRVTILGDATSFAMNLDAASLGPLTVGWLSYDTAVRIESTHRGYYQINVPTAGTLVASSAGSSAVGGPEHGVIHMPDRDAAFTGWATPAPVLALRIAAPALDHHLQQLLDRPVHQQLDLDMRLDLSSGRGAQWLALVRSLADDLADENALVRQPMVAAPFVQSVITGLLLTARHQYREELETPPALADNAAVRRACDYIEENAALPITVTDVARAAGIGVRGLQQSFQRAFGISPSDYVRHVRLREAHRDLLTADPSTTTVAEIADRWAFTHHGRFAQQYRQRYGTTPGDSLRRHP